MKSYIIKNNEFLKYFCKLPQKNKIHLIPTLNKDQLNTISEICKNFLKKKKLPQNDNESKTFTKGN